MRVYIVGSLRNPEVPLIANAIRAGGHEVFDDWFAAGPEADDYWRTYEKARGRTLKEALAGKAARNVFQFDKANIDASDVVVLTYPSGKSAHLELGYAAGRGKKTYILAAGDPDRWDVMMSFADGVCDTVAELLETLEAK